MGLFLEKIISGAALQNLLKVLERIVEDSSLSVPVMSKPYLGDERIIY